MPVSANQLLQAFNDAGVTDQTQVTRLVRIMIRNSLMDRQRQLAGKVMAGTPLTQAETAELASNEAALANLAQALGG